VWATTPPNFIKIERPLPSSGRSYLDTVTYCYNVFAEDAQLFLSVTKVVHFSAVFFVVGWCDVIGARNSVWKTQHPKTQILI